MAVEKKVFNSLVGVVAQGAQWGNFRLYPVEVCIQLNVSCAQTEYDDLLLSSERVDRVVCVWAGHVCENRPTCIDQY